jgi:hypothetical protein
MDYSDVVSGMEGYGITVFEGSKPDTFGVDIIGIRKGIAPGQDIILAKLGGKRIEETGVVSGMSGSPVYIDGKLLGAVSYNMGGAFSKEPICGITPIGNMLNPPKGGFSDIYIKEEIPIPVTFSNISDATISLFKNEIEKVGWWSNTGKFQISNPQLPTTDYQSSNDKFFPGSPIGVLLVSGDARVGAVGTVTHIEGDRVYAFGHRLMGLGGVELPVTTAHIHTVASSYLASFKIAETESVIGCMDIDAFTGISAVIGKFPSTVDMTVKNGDITYRYKLAKEERLLPLLTNLMLANSLLMSYSSGNITYSAVFNVNTKERQIKLFDTYSGNVTDVVTTMIGDVNSVLQNNYSRLEIESVEFDVTPSYELKTAQIKDIQGDLRDDTLFLICTIIPYRGKLLRIEKRIPIRSSDGEKPLMVSATGCDGIKMRMSKEVTDFDEFVRYLEKRPKRTSVVIQVLSQEDNSLPPSYSRFIKKKKRPLYEKVIETGWVISGKASCNIK